MQLVPQRSLLCTLHAACTVPEHHTASPPLFSQFDDTFQTLSIQHHHYHHITFPAGVDIEAQSPLRRKFSKFLVTALPLSMAGVLAWGFYEPDEQQLGAASSPRQVAVSGESVVNWSATHTAQPRCVGQGQGPEGVHTCSRLRSIVCMWQQRVHGQ